MITTQPKITTTSSGLERQGHFSMDAEDMPEIFKILRDSLYTNKHLAVLREYGSNTFDAHDLNGNQATPAEITFPTSFDLNLRFRDFGPGLSEEDVFSVFVKYGKSTKRNSNTTIGSFGIGCKSAFCMTDNFTVISYFDGYATTYLCHQDSTGLGQVSKLSSEKSDAPSGLEICVPVHASDIKLFVEEAKKIFVWFNPRPTIYGNEELANYVRNFKLDIVKESSTWKLYKTVSRGYSSAKNEIYCLMGNVPYPVNLEHFDSSNYKHKFFMQYNIGVALTVPLGAVSVAANRESLEYSKPTVAYLRQALENAYDEMASEFSKHLSSAPTYWEALKIYEQYSSYFGAINPVYKGEVIKSNRISINNPYDHNNHRYSDFLKDFSIGRSANTKNGSFRVIGGIGFGPSQNPILFVNRNNFPQSTLRARAFQYLLSNNISLRNSSCYLFSFTDDKSYNDFMARQDLDGVPFIDLEGIVVPPKIRTKRVYSTVDKSKIKVLKYNGTRDYPYSNCWSEDSIDEKAKIVYVKIDKYIPSGTTIAHFYDKLQLFKKLTNNPDLVVYGVKNNVKTPSHWVAFENYAQSILENKSKSADFIDKNNAVTFMNSCINMKMFIPYINDIHDGLFKNYVSEYKKMSDIWNNHRIEVEQWKQLFSKFGINIVSTPHTQNITDKYPLLHHLRNYSDWRTSATQIIDYINLID